MLTDVEAATAPVVTLKVALVAPAGMLTLAGTEAAPLLLESATCAPPVGAGPSSDTVPVAGLPPVTLDVVRPSAATRGGSALSVPGCVAPPQEPAIVTVFSVSTAIV